MSSLQAPDFTLLGKNDPSSASLGSILILSKSPWGVSIFRKPRMRSATSSRSFTSNAKAIRRTLPKVLISKGTREPLGFSNSSAGPTLCGARSLSLATRCATSVISSTGSTSVRIRFSSPSFSSSFTNSRKSAYATVLSCLAELYHERLSVLVNVERESQGHLLTSQAQQAPQPNPLFNRTMRRRSFKLTQTVSD